MDIGIPTILIILAVLPIIALISGIRKRAFLRVGLMSLFLLTSAGGCCYFWVHFDIPYRETVNKPLVGLSVFGIGGILAITMALLTILKRKSKAEQTSSGDVATRPAPEK